MSFALSRTSLNRLQGVHPRLRRLVEEAILRTPVDFGVIEGVRTLERQKQLVAAGASQTMRSRHLTGHAVDLACYVGPRLSWEWPLYEKLARCMKATAAEMDIDIEWGGDWETLKDGPHFQLSWERYPTNV